MIIFIPAPWKSGTHLIRNMSLLPGIKFVFEPNEIGMQISRYIRKKATFKNVKTAINNHIEENKLLIIQEKRLGFIIKELLESYDCKIIHFERNKYDWVYSHLFKQPNNNPRATELSLLDYPFLQTIENAEEFFKQNRKEQLETAWENFQKEPRKYQLDERVFYITYTNLINAPKQSTENICNFIGIKYDGNLFENAHRKSLYKERLLKGEIAYGQI